MAGHAAQKRRKAEWPQLIQREGENDTRPSLGGMRRHIIKIVIVEEVIRDGVCLLECPIHEVVIDKDAGADAERAIELLEIILSDTGLDKCVKK